MNRTHPEFDRKMVFPRELDLEGPGRRDYFVKFEHPTQWGFLLIPLTVLVGPQCKPGEGLLVLGSTHGNELEGPVTIKHLLREIETDAVLGRIILVPILNAPAFHEGRRESSLDGVNLNRAFPGDPRGTLTYQIAHFVQHHLFPRVHVVLDIHSGNESLRFPFLASVHHVENPEQRREMEIAARGFGTRIIMIYQNVTPGLLTSAAENMGKITVGTELGFGEAVQAEGIKHARRGIQDAAVRYGQLQGEAPALPDGIKDNQVLVDTSNFACHLLAPKEACFEPTVHCGDSVEQGQIVGYLHNFYEIDETPHPITAPHQGIIVCQAWKSRVSQGQTICQVGRIRKWSSE